MYGGAFNLSHLLVWAVKAPAHWGWSYSGLNPTKVNPVCAPLKSMKQFRHGQMLSHHINGISSWWRYVKDTNPICDGNFWLGENSMIHFSRHLRYAPSYNQPWKRCSPRTIQDWFYLFDIKELSFSTYHIHTMSPKMTPLHGVSEKIPERRPMLDKDPKTYCQSAPVHSIFHIPYLPSLAHKINSFALLSLSNYAWKTLS